MTTQSIGSYLLTNTYSLLQSAVEEKQLYAKASEMDKESGTTTMGVEISSYLAQVPKGDDNRLSFQDVADYREELGDKWDEEVMADLKELGVDTSKEFLMSYDPDTGKVTVPDGTDDAEIINKYFEDNPDKVKEFKTIIQLGKLASTAQTQLSQDQMMTDLQMDSINWWFQDNTDPSSWFSGGGLLALSQSSSTAYTGLNLTV